MGRKKKGCVYCNINGRDWDYVKFPTDLGLLGDEYETSITVSGRRSLRHKERNGELIIEFGHIASEPIMSFEVGINYCPFCGTKLPLQEGDFA